jgi:hypothetical protein
LLRNSVNKSRDQVPFRPLTDMGRAECVNDPMIILLMRDQRADADNRVVNVFWEFVAEFRANFVVAFTVVTIRRSEACKIRYRFDVHTSTLGMSGAWHILQHMKIFYAADAFTKRQRKVLLSRVTFK